MSFESVIDHCKGILVGCAVGDAIGIPFECYKFEQIQKIEERNSKPYLVASDYWRGGFFPKGITFGPGMHTDDSQLSSSVCRGLSKWANCGNFDDLMKHISNEHICELVKPPCPIGWGGTINAIKRLKEGVSYKESGNTIATGNGVLMKSVPLGFFYAKADEKKVKGLKLEGEERVRDIGIYNDITHRTSQHKVSANIFIDFLVSIFQNDGKVLNSVLSKTKLLESLIQKCIYYEEQVFHQKFEKDDDESTKIADSQYERLSDYLKKLLHHLDENDKKFCGLDNLTLVKISNEGTYVNIYSLTMVIGLCLSTPNGVDGFNIDLIKRSAFIGGDTDTNAAMVGAICGGLKGMEIFSEEYRKGLIHYKDFVRDGELFGKFMVSVI